MWFARTPAFIIIERSVIVQIVSETWHFDDESLIIYFSWEKYIPVIIWRKSLISQFVFIYSLIILIFKLVKWNKYIQLNENETAPYFLQLRQNLTSNFVWFYQQWSAFTLCFQLKQNSNVDNFLPDLHNPFKILCKILRTLHK